MSGKLKDSHLFCSYTVLGNLSFFPVVLAHSLICIYFIPPPLTVHFPMTRNMRYQPIFNGLKFMLHRSRVLNNIVITTVLKWLKWLKYSMEELSVQLSE